MLTKNMMGPSCAPRMRTHHYDLGSRLIIATCCNRIPAVFIHRSYIASSLRKAKKKKTEEA